ncbi:ABC transporter substrate-binding protein [Paenibacillus mesophilus]|uniref:ABC transporter substrate-binding protein n=1 Tax=Paenibacillus mesophilus TaxID=2582849 RepID=UPI00130528A7|nr:extracellular solute-binding protein [Paenibacillus mesophilus]
MGVWNKRWVRGSIFVLSLSVAAGCSGGAGSVKSGGGAVQAKGTPPVVSTEPVTLTIFNSSMGDELMKSAIIDPIQSKYPHITMKVVKKEKGSYIEDLLTAGTVPDIIMGDSSGDIPVYNELNVLYDMTPLVKKYGFNMSSIDPAAMEDVKAYTGDARIVALPRGHNVAVLYYNKDIFNKFGVPYPKDGMTWDEAVDLAKKVTRTDGGVQYRGLDFSEHILIPYNQMSLPAVDAASMKASVNTDKWKTVFEGLKRVYDMDGGRPAPADYGGRASTIFLKDKTLAMFASTLMFGALPDAMKNGLNWDVVTLPSFKEAPDRTIQMFAPFLGISGSSKNKDQAFMAIAHILSEELQVSEAKLGRISILATQRVKKEYGVDNDLLKGKNKEAFVKSKFAAARPSVTKYDPAAYAILRGKFKEVVLNNKDVNTALREAEEAINKDLEQKKAR